MAPPPGEITAKEDWSQQREAWTAATSLPAAAVRLADDRLRDDRELDGSGHKSLLLACVQDPSAGLTGRFDHFEKLCNKALGISMEQLADGEAF